MTPTTSEQEREKGRHADLLFAIFLVGSFLAHGVGEVILGLLSVIEVIRSIYYGLRADRAAIAKGEKA